MIKDNCHKILPCGHNCRGFRGEKKCLPCLNEKCAEEARAACSSGHCHKDDTVLEGITDEDFCTICFISELAAEPCIKLGCGHVFHMNCIKTIIENKWLGHRITFKFLECPSCNQPIDVDHCPQLAEALREAREIKDKVQ